MPRPPRDRDLDRRIALAHERFVHAMAARLPQMRAESKERYLGILSSLVGKLEIADMSLREIAQEVATDAASALLFESR